MGIPLNELAPVNPTAFNANPYIQDLAKKPKWTISTNDKAPCNAKVLVQALQNSKQDEIPYIQLYRSDEELVRLKDLDEVLPDTVTNRAFRLNINHDHLLLIDVEPTANQAIVDAIKTLPVAYAEHSMHGGYHLLLPIPPSIINETNQYLLELMAVKGPNNMFELLLNRHFVTFTRRVLPTPKYDYRNKNVLKGILFFLSDLVKYDKPRQMKRLKNANHKIATENIETELPNEQKKLLKALQPKIDKLRTEKSVQDYKNDYSSYEFAMAEKCLYYASYIQLKPIQTNPFYGIKDPMDEIKPETCIQLAYAMLLKVVPHRPKHETTRNGQPLLMYDIINVAKKSDTIKRGKERGINTNFNYK